MVTLPNGAIILLAATYAAPAPITGISNAAAAVVTAANTLAVGDYVEVISGWSRMTQKVLRVSAASAATFTLEGQDTTNVQFYPAGGGVGSFRKILTWTQLAQILSSQSNGGEQQFLEYQFLEGNSQNRIPTVKSASGLTFSVADDPTLAGYQVALAADGDRNPRGLRVDLPSLSKIVYNVYISLNTTPSLTVNEIMACEVTASLLNPPVRYAS